MDESQRNQLGGMMTKISQGNESGGLRRILTGQWFRGCAGKKRIAGGGCDDGDASSYQDDADAFCSMNWQRWGRELPEPGGCWTSQGVVPEVFKETHIPPRS
ncbi:hypothetical protein SAY87_002160 [Trapa incisa]|uniref:Uncharacterized protein n=1 Tax=Trapa incisa TaxID=236973 RepID=A0AAN7JTS1_9MYRT|nr:hypothetical protein SAY87_002160 [Trapa incisa]